MKKTGKPIKSEKKPYASNFKFRLELLKELLDRKCQHC